MSIFSQLNAKRILLVEEDPDRVEQWKNLLRYNGYEVESAYNCGDALAARHDRFAVALVNPAMRHRDGRSILEHVRDHHSFSRLPVLLLNELGEDIEQVLATIAQQLSGERIANIGQYFAPKRATRTATNPILRETQDASSVDPDFLEEPTLRTRTIDEQRKQLAALRTLSELGRAIAAVLDLDQVLNQVVEAAATLTNAEESLLLLPDAEDEALYLRAMKGLDESHATNFRIRNNEPIVGRVYRSGEPILINDRGLQRVKTEYFIRSAVYVPMRLKGQTIGVLGVSNRRSTKLFSKLDQELLLDLAAHAAVAIENARLYQERLVQNRRLETLVQAGMAVNSTLALQQVMLTIARQILKALDVDACFIKQRTSIASGERNSAPGDTAVLAENELFVLSQAWQAAWQPSRATRTPLEARPMLRQAVEQNGYYVVAREQGGTRLFAELQLLRQVGAIRLTVLPLRIGNSKPFGVIDLFHRTRLPSESPTSEIRARIRGLAAEIYARLRLLPNATLRAQPNVRPSAEIFSLAQEILNEAQADWLVLSIFTEDEQLLRLVQYGTAEFLETPRPEESYVPVEIVPIFQGEPWVNCHVRQPNLSEPLRDLLATYGAQSMLCLPLLIKGKVGGMFMVCDMYEPRTFHEDEISLATALIAQAATAIENARLYRDLERSLLNLKQTQASLVQAARLSTMGELAAVVAHQINNPLTTILADSELLMRDLPEDSLEYESVMAINRSGQRAHTVVKRLLSTARRANPEDKPIWVNVHQTIQNTLDLISTHLGRGGVQLEVELERDPPSFIRAQSGHFEDVWLNLLMNARDALNNRPDAAMGIISRRSYDALDVLVWDNGSGIPSEVRDNIFEPFFTTKPAGEGTGLGLYICKQIITQAGGRISVESAPGQGTVFRISLPVSERAEG